MVTLWAAKWAAQVASRAAGRVHRHSGPDVTLQNFIGSLVRYTVLIIGSIAVLQQLGVQTTSVLAALGAASLAIGLALQGGLSNVAAGVMILLLRPYRVGDNVEINGRTGRVKALDLFATRVTDANGRFVYIPNAKAFGDVIVNYTMNETIRIVMDFGIDYDDDIDLALSLLIGCAKQDERIAQTPAPGGQADRSERQHGDRNLAGVDGFTDLVRHPIRSHQGDQEGFRGVRPFVSLSPSGVG